jgi:hypothetical protein
MLKMPNPLDSVPLFLSALRGGMRSGFRCGLGAGGVRGLFLVSGNFAARGRLSVKVYGPLRGLGHGVICSFVAGLFCLALGGCEWDESLSHSDTPLSREAASKRVSIPFPASTSDVYYVIHSGGMQEFQLFVRFSAAPQEMQKAVADIFSDYGKKSQAQCVYTSVPVANGMRWSQISGTATALLPMPWWDTDSITNGFYASSTNKSDNIHVWGDVAHHKIYLCITD